MASSPKYTVEICIINEKGAMHYEEHHANLMTVACNMADNEVRALENGSILPNIPDVDDSIQCFATWTFIQVTYKKNY